MGEDNLQSELSNLALNDSFDVLSADRLLQVEKAVDATHATIVQQLSENHFLQTELQRKNELKKYKLGYVNNRSQLPDNIRNDRENEIRLNDQILLHSENRMGDNGYVDTGPCLSDLVHQIDLMKRIENQEIRTGNKANGSLNIIHGHQTAADKVGVSLVSSTLSISARYDEFSSDTEFRPRGIVSVAIAEGNDRLIAKQEILQKNQEQEMEILQLKKYLTEYSLKETKLCIEKQALEKRISHMSLVFDQQQQDLSSSASKANSYKQVIMEENVRLTYALLAAKEEESRFSDFLISFLANYGIESRGADAQTIVSNIKVLFRHLQERLLSTQENLKETEYELAPWQHEQKNELDLVPQPLYSGIKMLSSPHRMEIVEDASIFHQTGLNDLDRNSPIAGRNTASDNMFSPDAYHVPRDEGTGSRKVTFEENVSREMDETEGKRHQGGSDPNWNSSGTLDDPDSSPSLPTVLEEPSSSFSEAAEDDPLPAIEGLQISGKACPGEELQACGYSVNGTTSCNFEWVRHLEDGSFNYIDGAKQPTYLVTADDVDAYLSIEVQPLDDRKRKGDLVRVFANDHRKIACDALMVNCIEKTLYSGHASFTLLMSTGFLNIWEPATLSIKRSGYSIKRVGTNSSVVAKKFSSSMIVSISPESPTDFSIVDSMETEQILRSENPDDISCSRDTIVLTLRRFILKAGEKKSRKISLFFNMQNKR